MAASFPTNIVSYGANVDGTTVINAAYVGARDDEIEALEICLGAGLVSSAALVTSGYSLSDYLTAVDGYLSLGHVAGTNVWIGDAVSTIEPEVPLEIVSTNPRIRLQDTNGSTFQMRSQANQWELTRFSGGGGARLMAVDATAPADSLIVDGDGNLAVAGESIGIRTIGTSAPGTGDGSVGDIRIVDLSGTHYIYAKVSSSVWKRVQIS